MLHQLPVGLIAPFFFLFCTIRCNSFIAVWGAGRAAVSVEVLQDGWLAQVRVCRYRLPYRRLGALLIRSACCQNPRQSG
jgi:hypothetical protein